MKRTRQFRYVNRLYSSGASCPVCYGKDLLLLYEIDSREAAQHFILREVNNGKFAELVEHIERLWQSSNCKVFRCAGCSFCFAFPFAAGDKRFYALAYERTGYPPDKWEYKVTTEFLIGRISRKELQNVSLLEVGAGDGDFIRRISPSAIRKENILATEYSGYGIREIRKYGVECVEKDVRDLRDGKYRGAFGVLCLFQVLEHLDDLDGLFCQLNFLAKNESLLFISVPSDEQIAYNEQHGALLDMPPNHIGRWNRECFQIIGERHGWKILDHRYERERLLPLARRFLVYRYLQTTQVPGTIANRIRSIRDRYRRRLLEIAYLGISAPLAIPHFLAMKILGIGDSQWVCLQREA